jgi:uncharacterized protein (UPF0264 family)
MISVVSAEEARTALQANADLLDAKNPAEGSLGAQFPGIIKEIIKIASGKAQVSAAIGDMPNLPGTASLAALGAASCGVDYIKIGLLGPQNASQAASILREAKSAVRESKVSIIAAAYADCKRAGSLNPELLPTAAASAGAHGCLLDTFLKDGRPLFEFINPETLRKLINQAHDSGLLFGIAGALTEKDIPLAKELGADIVGLRTSVCRNGQRRGQLDEDLVRKVMKLSRSGSFRSA